MFGRNFGVEIVQNKCLPTNTSVWVIVDDKGECVRFYASGVKPNNELVHVWFHGDRMRMSEARYNSMTPEWLQDRADRIYNRYEIPYIQFSRPGTHGSSGHHGQRRRPRESKIVNAALNKIKARYGVGQYVLSGQSGGGHIVASLLTMRADVGCAVITSGVVAVSERLLLRNRSLDLMGYDDYFDPIDHVDNIATCSELKIFIVGDPQDASVAFETQQSYFDALKSLGHNVWLVRGNARGNTNHGLAWLGFKIIEWCIDNLPEAEIVERAKSLN